MSLRKMCMTGEMVTWIKLNALHEMVFSGRITLKNKFLSSLTGVEPMIIQKYQLDALTTEL